jgi:hypothetical protein
MVPYFRYKKIFRKIFGITNFKKDRIGWAIKIKTGDESG